LERARIRARKNRSRYALRFTANRVLMAAGTAKPRVMSGMRPTGNLHLGHYVGVLTQWVNYCDTADAFFEIADLHALTTGFSDPQSIRDARNSMVVDWLAAGVDPKKSTFYLQ